MTLIASDDELHDLEQGSPVLGDTGITIQRWVGAGGMSTVFLGHADASAQSRGLPGRVAVKFLQASTVRRLRKLNIDPKALIHRELHAHLSVMNVKPPTPFVVGCYASGDADIEIDRATVRLPWIALEYVDGGRIGTSLEERIDNNGLTGGGGVDATRALRIASGLITGLRVLHAANPIVIHRDLKPQNILVTGPVDDEIPKIADFGIARLQGVGGSQTIHAADLMYAPYEQLCGTGSEVNPLIGPWTDVHALSAVLWFVLAGNHWAAEAGEIGWRRGDRPSVLKSSKLHPSLRREDAILEKIQTVLATGASARLPDTVDPLTFADSGAAARYVRALPQIIGGPRFATAAALGEALLPLMEELESSVRRRASAEGALAPTLFRPTQLLRIQDFKGPLAEIESAAPALGGASDARIVVTSGAGSLSRIGGRLFFYLGAAPQEIPLEGALRASFAQASWLVRSPQGFAAIGEGGVVLVEHGSIRAGALPSGNVGKVQSTYGDANRLLLVTAETDDSDGPELWTSTDGTSWRGPVVIEKGPNKINVIAPGPGGVLVVGSNKKGDKGRASLVGFDDRVRDLALPDGLGALTAAVAGTGVEAWAAGQGFILRLHVKSNSDAVAEQEKADVSDTAIAMALDPIGNPWLVTSHSVLRRHLDGVAPVWRVYNKRAPTEPAFVGIGFEARSAVVMDASGAMLRLRPRDAGSWGSVGSGETG